MSATPANLRIADAAAIAHGGEIIRAGGLVAFPTETVYGLGADATNDRAVAAIFAAKGRPQFNPLIVHVPDIVAAEAIVEFSPLARKLAQAFWPGALTLVLPRKQTKLSLLVSAGLDTVAVRAPSGSVAQKLLKAAATPIAAPSANVSGRVSPTLAAHVAEEFGEAVDLILDDGAATLGLESTVIGFDGEKPVLLRLGAMARDEIEAVSGPLAAPGAKITSPGQLINHYAPRAPLRLNARDVKPGEALLAFGAHVPEGARVTSNLSSTGDVKEAAANLFAMLRELDASGADGIAVMPVPEKGLGEAINDRLRRAAAPRT
ncbi:MAG TPA: L-threonylcarbamoyladenylate synthase [Rhizomicrobium sp.]|nr:L-threonylcarbamoyladenylate synthase [Rhizomicrobium sp.]